MKEKFWSYIWSAAGITFACAVLLLASRWVIAQEVEEQMMPIQAEQAAVQKEYQQFSKTVADMQFEERYGEVQIERDKCMEEHTVVYCDGQAKWRWDVYYPYVNCISGLEYAKWEDACGPEPRFVPPVENG